MRILLALVITLAAGAPLCGADAFPAIQAIPAFPKLRFELPLDLVPTAPGRWLVVEQAGTVRAVLSDAATEAPLVYDQRAAILSVKSGGHNEEGLLAMTLHPRAAENGRVFLYWCADKPRRTVLGEARIGADGRIGAGKVLLEIAQPFGNHKGSDLAFGPDGMLYLGPGDGGSGGDPQGNGQKLDTLLGKILRLDVDKTQGKPYAVPADNPFVGNAGARGEIWAYGLRNPWRFSFDRETGELWAGDVGQNAWEEIDVIVKGGNYGWNLREGRHDFKRGDAAPELIEPVGEYPRGLGVSITGGYVYRGKAIAGLQGAYVYGDFQSGRIWALRRVEGGDADNREICQSGLNISSFAEDAAGELYLTAFDGRIYRLAAK